MTNSQIDNVSNIGWFLYVCSTKDSILGALYMTGKYMTTGTKSCPNFYFLFWDRISFSDLDCPSVCGRLASASSVAGIIDMCH